MKKAVLTICLVITGFIFLMFFVVVVMIGSSVNSVNKAEDNKNEAIEKVVSKNIEPEIKITADELAKAYNENELRADEKYKNKLAEITGEVENISKMFDSTSISLKGSEWESILCFFPKSQEKEIAKLNKGDKITVIGYIDGYGLTVDISKCKLKK